MGETTVLRADDPRVPALAASGWRATARSFGAQLDADGLDRAQLRARVDRVAPFVVRELGDADLPAVRALDVATVADYPGSVATRHELLTDATAALALYWGALSLGRLASAAWSDRFDHARLAAIAAIASGIALVGAVAVPSLPVSILLFGVVGFAFGPIYPLIMAVAGDRYPTRAAAVSGLLAGCAVIGGVVYPPLMGFMSVTVGLGPAMTGAGILALASGIALVLVARARSTERAEALEAATSA